MNTQNIILNRSNVVEGTNKTKYVYKFPTPVICKDAEIALSNISIYYSWRNIQSFYNNNKFSYLWFDISGNLSQRVDIVIPDGNYSISLLSDYIKSQMLLKGHYVVDANSQKKVYFIEFVENAIYYSAQITFTSMFARGSADATTNYINENPPTQDYDENGNLVYKGWQFPAQKTYPKIIFDDTSNIKKFFGFDNETIPADNTPIALTTDVLSSKTPETMPVSSVLIQSNFCRNDLAIPNNILFSFSSGTSSYGDILEKSPTNLQWLNVPDGTYSQLDLTFIDQDYMPMKILDDQLNITLLLRQ